MTAVKGSDRPANRNRSFLVIFGPGLDLPGAGKTGKDVRENIRQELRTRAKELDVAVDCRQCVDEAAMLECLGEAPRSSSGIIVNAGSLAESSHALPGAISSTRLPCIEVFNPTMAAREELRHTSLIGPVCVGVISGFGRRSYLLALEALANLTEA
jgi:3-dehydroquinate dehydratase II